MAVAAMDFLLDNLTQLLRDNADLIRGLEDEVTSILYELRTLKAFLTDTNTRRRRSRSEILRHFIKELNTMVNIAEITIDKFMIEAKLHKKKGMLKFFDISHIVKARSCCLEIRFIRERLKDIQRDRAYGLSMSLQYEDSKQTDLEVKRFSSQAPVIEEDEVVGFKEEVEIIINRLLGGSAHLEFIPIVGMPGVGKTTLAKKIFKNVGYEFNNRIWVYVSQSYTRRDLFLNIINQFTRNTEQYRYLTEHALAEVIHEHLLPEKYLIVLDDVWTLEVLNDIKMALPNNFKSRVLLTTRDSKLAEICCDEPHHLKFLSPNECWELLKKKVFHKDECPPDLEELGMLIARKCMGLPLAILVIAGALTGRGKTKSEWERVHQGVNEHIISSDSMMTKNLVQMSCDSLPDNLQACFLYCGAFPRGSEIPVWKIVRLWIAEGFVRDPMQSTLETLAEEYLNVLVSKSLLMVTQWTSNGQIKTFRMHDMLHEFCTLEASEENLFEEIKLGVEQSFPRNQELATFRRLSIDSSVQEFISTKPYADSIRSFLCFSSPENMTSPDEFETISKSFPLLRVLDIESILFPRFSKQFFQLYHLRYIAISSDSLKILPKYMGDLWNLQTLIVMTQQKTLDIQADICNMPHFRHLHTNASAKLRPSAVNTNNRGALQTLSKIEPKSCTEHVLARCQNLKRLDICGNITELVGPFDLEYLETLKLINLAGGKSYLRAVSIFPRRLKKLTLSGTWLDWNEMGRVLGHLEFLEVLKLKENAFTGDRWNSKDCVFPCLKVLLIERLDLVYWEASNKDFPSLKRLVLRSLDKLVEVPIQFANMSNLQMVELKNTTGTLVESAREIKSNSVCNEFKLIISSPVTISDCN